MALGKVTSGRVLSGLIQIRCYSAPAERSTPAAKQKYVPTSGSYPKGFLAGAAHAGVKASNTKYDDIALVVSEVPCVAAEVVTRNIFKAAPIIVSRGIIHARKHENIRGVVVNSGCANAVTGTKGREDAEAMAYAADACFDHVDRTQTPQTLVMSTGVIGQRLPMDKIGAAIPKAHAALGTSHEHWLRAAQAICTTDTFPKLICRKFTLPSHPETEYTLAGTTKGAGMIHPNMGTLLGIVCTDAKVAPASIYQFLRQSVDRSFNCISIDGDTSTNDTVALFANGAAAPSGAEPLSIAHRQKLDPDAQAFVTVLNGFMADLAKLVVRDGEGATKFVTIRVTSDVSKQIARRASTSIAQSSLVKTAIYGKDANWGRILCAIGYAPGIMENPRIGLVSEHQSEKSGKQGLRHEHQINARNVSLSFVPGDDSEVLKLFTRGEPEDVDEVRAKEILEMEDLEISVKLNDHGDTPPKDGEKKRSFEELFWTCDLSHEYVTINGDYRT